MKDSCQSIHPHIYIYIYIYIRVCVRLCRCVLKNAQFTNACASKLLDLCCLTVVPPSGKPLFLLQFF